MSWLLRLYEVYDYMAEAGTADGLLPIAHTTQNAQLEVTINEKGDFVTAIVVKKSEAETVIPCTEESAGRSGSAPVQHPLMDKLQYVARDYVAYGGKKGGLFHEKYIRSLEAWAGSKYCHPKVKIIYAYLKKGCLIHDLVNVGVLYCGDDGSLLERWQEKSDAPKIYKVSAGLITDSFVRFRVISQESPISASWLDKKLQQSFIDYYLSSKKNNGICSITGKSCFCTVNHPGRIRNSADMSKLISANDKMGFTYKGRFLEAAEAVQISYEVSQKAHNALKYLLKRQGQTFGTKSFLVCSSEGLYIPGIFENSFETSRLLKGGDKVETDITVEGLKEALWTYYHKRLENSSVVTIMGLAAATTGRMAITFYREMSARELIHRIKSWHEDSSGELSLKEIALAAFGAERNVTEIDEMLYAATVERLLHCILDSEPIPYDIVKGVYRNACRPQNYLHKSNWYRVLAICCTLIKKYRCDKYEDVWAVELQKEFSNLSYLCGRLLAVSDAFERKALIEKGENRETAAIRYFTGFQENPNRAWRSIKKCLISCDDMMGAEWKVGYEKMFVEIYSRIPKASFEAARNLDGRMALGFFSQQKEI